MAAKKPIPAPVDWPRIAVEYRAGIKSNRELGREFGVSEGAIRKEAKKEGWKRDLNAKVRELAAEKVRSVGTQSVRTEAEVVENEATVLAAAETGQRATTAKAIDVVSRLVTELSVIGMSQEALDRLPTLADAMAEDIPVEAKVELLADYHAVISVPGRVDNIKKLADAWSKLVTVQRAVLKMDAGQSQSTAMDVLREVMSGA